MESIIDIKTKTAGKKIIKYCKESNLFEPIAKITIIGTYLSRGIDISSLEAYMRGEGIQWEKVKIAYETVPARVECNVCGTRYNSQEDWWPCPNCGFPGEYAFSSTPLHIRLKEIQFESGKVIKAKRNTIVL